MGVAKLFSRLGHYVSTYCMHNKHSSCRLTCKVCGKPCRCKCHKAWKPFGPI